MSDRPEPYSAVEPVDLAHAADFMLGDLQVRPSACETLFEGRAERLEPRVMQVLIALARAEGKVVSRDDLTASCWGGVTVGDDAINRALGKLRRLSERCAGRSFVVETVPRIGYRLVAAAPSRQALQAVAAQVNPQGFRFRRIHLAGAAVVLALAGVVGTWTAWRNMRPRTYSVEQFQAIADDAGMEVQGALSPDGAHLVYSVTPAQFRQTSDLYLQTVESREAPAPLTQTPTFDEQAPAWSPNGDSIAFVRADPVWNAASRPCRIFVRRMMPGAAEEEKGRCAEGTNRVERLAWDPSGRKLIYAEGATLGEDPLSGHVRELDLETLEVRDLLPPPRAPAFYADPAFAPDGRRIAFVLHRGTSPTELVVYDIERRRLHRPIPHGATQAFIAWAPDSRSLFVASDRLGPIDLWQVRADGIGAPRRMGFAGVRRLSRARDRLAYEQYTVRRNLVTLRNGRESSVARGNREDFDAAVSQTGVLAFIRRQGGYAIHIRSPNEQPQRPFGLELREPRGLRWARDGRMLAFAASTGESAHLYLFDSKSRLQRRLETQGVEPGKPDWSLDGKSLVFVGRDGSGSRLWRMAIELGARPEAITEYNIPPRFQMDEVLVTREGVFVAQSFGKDGVYRLHDVRGPELLTREIDEGGDIAGWTVFEGRLHYIYADAQTIGLYWRPARGGPRRRIAEIAPPFEYGSALAVNPVTRDIVYSRTTTEYDIGVARVRASRGSWEH